MKLFYQYMAIFFNFSPTSNHLPLQGGGPRVEVSTAAFHARVRGSVPGLGGLKETKMFLPHPRVKVNIVGSLRDREVACSAIYVILWYLQKQSKIAWPCIHDKMWELTQG